MKIKQVIGREIYDSRGVPTLECNIIMEDGTRIISSVPSGLSRGRYEAHELRDKQKRLNGLGVQTAIENLETTIGAYLINKEPNLLEMDTALIHLDGTPDKSNLGANSILAASMAIARAQAHVEGQELFEFITSLLGQENVGLPCPLINLINGGAHADNNLRIQEYMIVPLGADDFRTAMEMAQEIFLQLKLILQKEGLKLYYGDEGGLAGDFKNDVAPLEMLTQAITNAGYTDQDCMLALDVAASEFYDAKKKIYSWNGKKFSTDDLIELYDQLSQLYPIYSIEDGLSQDDVEGWQKLTTTLGENLQIVGDDLFATNATRIVTGIEQGYANAAIIKPNQIGTITETLQALSLCKENEIAPIISHRSGETNDTFIADLAVGTSAGQIKAGGCTGGERLAKYNRLLEIEDDLAISLMGFEGE